MSPIIYVLLGVFVGVVAVYVIYKGRGVRVEGGVNQSPNQEDIKEKEKNMGILLDYLNTNGTVTNDQVEKLLLVSDATAERYLAEFEKEGTIVQVGQTGRSVTYRKA
jgi:predicted HTH transcriptional regulator